MQDVTDVLMNSWISMKFNSVQNDMDLMYLIRMLLKREILYQMGFGILL